MTLTSKGQVTIPIEIREALGLLPGTASAARGRAVAGPRRSRSAGPAQPVAIVSPTH
jgi:hypothetical protein